MTKDQFDALVKYHAKQLGMNVAKVCTKQDDLGYGLANTSVTIRTKDREATYKTMRLLGIAIRHATRQDVRLGFYDATIGYDEVPKGMALIEIDLHKLAF